MSDNIVHFGDATETKHDKPRPNGNGRPPDTQVEPFPFTTYSNAATISATKAQLLKGLLAIGETSAWVGAPGSLKSSLLASVAHAVAKGDEWCGKLNKGRKAVIYFALERADLVKRRLRALAERKGDKDENVPIVVVAKTIDFMSIDVVTCVLTHL
jgi:hypothetical protein